MHAVALQLLQEDLEMEQVRVNSLTHMVVVVDESSGDSATAALESKLQVRLHVGLFLQKDKYLKVYFNLFSLIIFPVFNGKWETV